jgi:hypothetical protein
VQLTRPCSTSTSIRRETPLRSASPSKVRSAACRALATAWPRLARSAEGGASITPTRQVATYWSVSAICCPKCKILPHRRTYIDALYVGVSATMEKLVGGSSSLVQVPPTCVGRCGDLSAQRQVVWLGPIVRSVHVSSDPGQRAKGYPCADPWPGTRRLAVVSRPWKSPPGQAHGALAKPFAAPVTVLSHVTTLVPSGVRLNP